MFFYFQQIYRGAILCYADDFFSHCEGYLQGVIQRGVPIGFFYSIKLINLSIVFLCNVLKMTACLYYNDEDSARYVRKFFSKGLL